MQNAAGGRISCPYPDCQERFASERDFAQHLLGHTALFPSNSGPTSFTCSVCNFTLHFASAEQLSLHHRNAHVNHPVSQEDRHW